MGAAYTPLPPDACAAEGRAEQKTGGRGGSARAPRAEPAGPAPTEGTNTSDKSAGEAEARWFAGRSEGGAAFGAAHVGRPASVHLPLPYHSSTKTEDVGLGLPSSAPLSVKHSPLGFLLSVA